MQPRTSRWQRAASLLLRCAAPRQESREGQEQAGLGQRRRQLRGVALHTGAGASGPLVPAPALPTHPSSNPHHRSLGPRRRELAAEKQQGGRRGSGHRAVDGGGGGRGDPDQEAEDQTSSFSVPGFLPEPHTSCAPCAPSVLGRGVLSGVVDFFSLKQLLFSTQWRGVGRVQCRAPVSRNRVAVRAAVGSY